MQFTIQMELCTWYFVLCSGQSTKNQAQSYVNIAGGQIMIRPFRGVHPQIHSTAYVDPSAQVIGDVHLGEEASIWCNCTVRGDIHYIRIGDRANIQDNSVIHVRNGTHPTILEAEVTVGHSVTLHGCYVERGSLVGIGAVVLDDVRIGELSLVAAGSVVSPGTIIPPRALVMGFPARVISAM